MRSALERLKIGFHIYQHSDLQNNHFLKKPSLIKKTFSLIKIDLTKFKHFPEHVVDRLLFPFLTE